MRLSVGVAVFTGFLYVIVVYNPANAVVMDLDDALRATYTACVGIDEELTELKKMAGINTAVTAVGTAAGAGATVTGLVKASKDKQIAELKMDNLQRLTDEGVIDPSSNPSRSEVLARASKWYEDHKNDANMSETASKVEQLTDQSKKLGNWRTGLLGGAIVTNVAGAIIAGNNKVDKTLQEQIDGCITATKNLSDSMMQARADGRDITEAKSIVSACSQYETVDISKINKRATGAMVSATVGAATGVSGTAVSAVANSSNVRNEDSVSGIVKENNLNTAANVLAAGTTVASGVATVFNATQISAIKRVASVAEQCTGVLK